MALLTPKYSYDNFKDTFTFGKGLMIADIVTTTTYTKSGIPIRSATSGGMEGIKKILPLMYTSPIEVFKISDKEVSQYLHLLFALKENNLMYIYSSFISNILDLLRCLEDNYSMLISDIQKGSINSKLGLDSQTRKILNNMLEPDAARADFLKNEFEKGTKGICRRIWLKLAYIATVTGANSIYDDKMYFTWN